MSNYNTIHLFIQAAEKWPQRVVLIHEGRPITYAVLLEQVKNTALDYCNKGIQQGDRILVFIPMSIELYRIVLALFYIGACPVFLDEWVSLRRLKQCCETVPCNGMIAGRKLIIASWFINVLRRIPLKIPPGLHKGNIPMANPVVVKPEDTALITFTTGTTGIPKAANRTHEFLQAQYQALQPLLNNDATVSLVSLPVVVLINMGMGKSTLLPASKFSAKKPATARLLLQDMIATKADEIICSPSMLLNISSISSDYPLFAKTIRYIFTGGGAVFPRDADKIKKAFPAAMTTVVYGSTEAEPISHIDLNTLIAADREAILHSGLPVGTIDASVQCAIIPVSHEAIGPQSDLSWLRLALPSGSTGEIVVTGKHVLKQYINNPHAEELHKINIAGQIWHRTGDAGMIQDNGKLCLLGPKKEIIDHNGVRHYPLITSCIFAETVNLPCAALVLLKGQLLLVAETRMPIEKELLQTALNRLQLHQAMIIYMLHIPKDKRHNTKVDYDVLKDILQKRLT